MQRLSYLICSALFLFITINAQSNEHCRIKHDAPHAVNPAVISSGEPAAANLAADPAVAPAAPPPPAPAPAPAPKPESNHPGPGPTISGGPGYCYEPYHDDGFPMSGKGNPNNILGIIERDFQMFQRDGVKTLHTYMTTYFGKDYISIAAKYGIRLYAGIHLFDDKSLEEAQIQAALNAVRHHPGTILGFIIGNENLPGNGGKYSADALMGKMDSIRGRFRSQGLKVPPMGTAQRINEWLSNAPGINALAANSDFIGVNIYPFYTPGWNPAQPTALLDAQFNQMKQRHPQFINKFVILESGWATGGSPPPGFPNNIPNVANAKAYYEGFMKWNPNVPHFWFMSHDRRLDDPAAKPLFEAYFGRYTKDGQKKF